MYRVYSNFGKGYKIICRVKTYEMLIKLLDYLIIEKDIPNSLIVIEENQELRCDIPIFLYLGNKEEYLAIRDNHLSRRKK